MTIYTKKMVSISDANQNFSKVARLVDECGSAVILKNNVPRYLVIDFSKADKDTVMELFYIFLDKNDKPIKFDDDDFQQDMNDLKYVNDLDK